MAFVVLVLCYPFLFGVAQRDVRLSVCARDLCEVMRLPFDPYQINLFSLFCSMPSRIGCRKSDVRYLDLLNGAAMAGLDEVSTL